VDLHGEQVKLLQKADQFMSELFSRSSKTHEQPQQETEKEKAVRLEPRVQEPTPPRLAQTPPPLNTTTDSATSSLVIGKLTVEVTPPSAASPPPPQQTVVYRNGRSSMSSVPSSRRFGLGQF
jgi:hypothetical protein